MRGTLVRGAVATGLVSLGVALAANGANAQTVISRSVTTQPVETTVTQTPTGTIVTRRPVDVQPSVSRPPVVETVPNEIDTITTREVVQRRDASEASRQFATRQVSAHPAKRTVRRTATTARTTRVVRPRLALNDEERQIIYQTIVKQEVVPTRPVFMPPAPQTFAAPAVQLPVTQAPIVAADDEGPVYAVGSVLPANVPLYAMPQNVSLTVPATSSYSYAYLGGRAYLVEPTSGVIVADVTE